MKIFRKAAAVIMCFVLIAALAPTQEFFAADGDLIDGVYYKIYGNYAAVVGCSNTATEITILSEYHGSPVTKIADSAFENKTSLKKVTIADSVTSIERYTFYGCSELTSLIIPDSVIIIGEYAFYGCSKLTTLTIPDSVTSIGTTAFFGCKGLISITIPDSVTHIRDHTFTGCKGLTSITIPDSVTSIGEYAFNGCTGLTSITIPDSVTSIENGAFSACTGLTSITIPDSVTSIGKDAFRNCTGLTSITIPDSVTSIGDHAFHNCTGLTSITIPDSVTSIGWYAFDGCTGLASITIPDSVTSIGKYAFSGCRKLTIKANDGSYAAVYARKNKIPLYLFSKTPESPIIKEYEYDKENGYLIITVDADIYEPFEYSTDCVTWQKDPVLKVKVNPDGKYKVYQRVAATSDYNESFPSKPAIVDLTPPTPTVSYTTENSVVLNAVDGFEYKMDNGEWQDSNIFDNLPVNSTHNFYQREKATATSLAGLESSPLSVTTAKHVHTAVGGWQTDASGHYKLCSCGQEIDRENHSGGEATCSSVAVCEICGTSYGEKNLTNHKNTEIRGTVAAICSKEGYSGDIYCLDCGEKIVSGKTVDKLKHSYKDEVVPPTFGKQGYTLHTCTLCGDTYKDNYTSYVPSETDPVIKVSSVRGILGNQVKVAVSLKNNPGIVSMALQLNYDENVLKLINVEDCGVLGTQVHNPTLGTPYYLNWVNDTATANFTTNGDIVILTFEVLENAALGKTAVTVSYTHDNYEIYDKDGTEVNFAVESGYVDVSDILIGDVNGDGVVNGKYRLLLTRWLAKWNDVVAEGINETAADVNCDGKVNGLDRLILTRHLARWEEYATLPYTK